MQCNIIELILPLQQIPHTNFIPIAQQHPTSSLTISSCFSSRQTRESNWPSICSIFAVVVVVCRPSTLAAPSFNSLTANRSSRNSCLIISLLLLVLELPLDNSNGSTELAMEWPEGTVTLLDVWAPLCTCGVAAGDLCAVDRWAFRSRATKSKCKEK